MIEKGSGRVWSLGFSFWAPNQEGDDEEEIPSKSVTRREQFKLRDDLGEEKAVRKQEKEKKKMQPPRPRGRPRKTVEPEVEAAKEDRKRGWQGETCQKVKGIKQGQ